ncbi:zinc finger BED domain-containing protein 4-like [Salarias fasciatus]|uniref:zinc finger BED domain-containing protein 4-like n=2 Tax=Salarias fasciatus TaxID=181472 RepID=UPI001176CA68|nr:zinc finger BED domain-containing protein 4-like [Salarias fasciatus]
MHPEEHVEFKKRSAEKEKEKQTPKRMLKQTTLDSAARPYSRDSEKARGGTRRVLEFIVMSDLPFNIVENPAFQRLLTYFDPRYRLPGHTYCGETGLSELHRDVRSRVESLLMESSSSISLTTDIWSSDVSPMSLLSLTAQWIDPNFKLRAAVLHAQEFRESHSAAALVTKYENMLQTWQIPRERVHVVLRDNAANMAKAMREGGLPTLPCMAHTLQLAIHDGLLAQRMITDILATGRRIIGHFKRSPQAYCAFHDVQQQLGQNVKKFQQDVTTRWNSSFYMLQSLLEQKRALAAYGAEHEVPASFSANQWGLIEHIITILEPFEELTRAISSSTASAADVIPSVLALKRFLSRDAPSDRGVMTAKAELLRAVTRRFDGIEDEPLYSLATLLDPRYKDRCYSAELKAHTREQLLELLDAQSVADEVQRPEASNADEPAEKKARLGSLSSMLGEIMQEERPQKATTAMSQLNLYLSEPVILQDADPLAYWRANQDRFSALTTAARAYLSAPCTSVDSERLFSTASNILDAQRSRLSARKVEMLLFVRKNLPLMLEKA